VSLHEWQQSWATWLLALIACGLATVGIVAWRRRAVAAARWLAGLCLAAAVWALADGLGTAAVSLAHKVVIGKVECLAILGVGPCWLLMAHAFAGRPPLRRRSLALLCVVPLLCVPVIVANWRGLIWSSVWVVSTPSGFEGRYSYGLVLWTMIVYTYVLATIGVVRLIQAARSSSPTYRRQALVLVAVAALPLAFNTADQAGLTPFGQNIDLAPLAFGLGVLLVGWIMLRQRFLEIAPLARDALLRTLPDGVLVIDRQEWLVEVNPGACELLGVQARALVGPVADALTAWPALAAMCRGSVPAVRELELGDGTASQRLLEVRVTALTGDAGHAQGRLVTLHDITERARALADLRDQTGRLSALLRAGRAIAGSLDYDEVLRRIVTQGRVGLAASACLLYEYVADEDVLVLCARDDEPGAAGSHLPVAHRRAARHVDRGGRGPTDREPLVSTGADESTIGYPSREPFPAAGETVMIVPLLHRERLLGELVWVEAGGKRSFAEGDRAFAGGLGEQAALAMANARLYDQIRHLHLGNLRALSSALNARDYYTMGHAGRVAAYMTLLGHELGWSEEQLGGVHDVAYLHDIGKIGVSDRVLQKAGPLNAEEWVLMHQHPTVSAEIVAPLFDHDLVAGVRHHHERYDGAGYPDGLAGDEIPVVARALCVADSYDAMSYERPYRAALTYNECCAELRACSGSQFDPEMAGALLRALERLEATLGQARDMAVAAARLVDTTKHGLLRSRADEERPEYRQMVAALRGFRDSHPTTRFITTFALVDGLCITVLDTGETEDELSHCGDQWFAGGEIAAALEGRELDANVLYADEFGVWVTGTAPLRAADGSLVGVLSVDLPAVESPGLQQLHTDLSRTLASMLHATTLRVTRAELEAISDGLTGLYNHRYLHERLEEELDRARALDGELALLFIDLDDFKAHNDALGHKAGDEALRRVARILEGCGRQIDLVARYGGDEFVLLLTDSDAAGACEVAERVRRSVAATDAAGGLPLTVSIGIATFPGDARTKDELLDKADWALYAAKRAGRDRVVRFAPRVDAPQRIQH
jgi:diguanylate cyclase (GGDEF)-like protein